SGRDSILIDLSSWQKGSLTPKIEIIQSAIENRHLLEFEYYSPSGESKRKVEPYYLIFRWSSWYLWAYCTDRKDFRLFKLNRMLRISESKDSFNDREVIMPDLSDEKIFPKGIRVKALFDPSVGWRLNEEFGENSFNKTDDGKLLLETDYSDIDSIVTWFLTFGDKVEILEPQEVRDRMIQIIDDMKNIYKE
ncbi:MAG: WYL domain-containing protein, partial [Erysipelotrichaceae bacterium]|nr:WYL domain-containing protein [Erysipelotrichaceae bacterium]